MVGIVVWGKSIRPHFKHASLPGETIEHIYGTACIFSSGKKNSAVASGSVVRTEGYVCAENCACAPKKVFEILPANAIRKLRKEVVEGN